MVDEIQLERHTGHVPRLDFMRLPALLEIGKDCDTTGEITQELERYDQPEYPEVDSPEKLPGAQQLVTQRIQHDEDNNGREYIEPPAK